MRSPRVSICMPSYNHQKYVGEAIQSVLDQTFIDFELLITDDASSDGTVAEILRFNDPRIKLFQPGVNRGSASAVLHSLAQSRGEFIGVLNSDDTFLPEKLAEQVRFLDENPDVKAVFSFARIIDEEGQLFKDAAHFYYHVFYHKNRSRYKWLNYFFFQGNCLCHPSMLVRREFYSGDYGPDPRFFQMYDFNSWVQLCLEHEIHILQKELVCFRLRSGEGNASAVKPETMIRSLWEQGHIQKHFLKICKLSEFQKIFPGFSPEQGEMDERLISFYLAQLALQCNSRSHQRFALEVIHSMLGDPQLTRLLSEKHGFHYRDYLRLTGNTNLYGIRNRETQINKTHRWRRFLNGYLRRLRWRYRIRHNQS